MKSSGCISLRGLKVAGRPAISKGDNPKVTFFAEYSSPAVRGKPIIIGVLCAGELAKAICDKKKVFSDGNSIAIFEGMLFRPAVDTKADFTVALKKETDLFVLLEDNPVDVEAELM